MAFAQDAQGVDPELPAPGQLPPPPPGRRWEVYTDGACIEPRDPRLARAAWAVVVPGAGRTWAGPVQGQQTAQRG
eukprot:11155770-Lingulodinium_polyedra.AAC.1